ncbi:DUF7344 domain-containing protein [Haladaptatus halobius]|uniref:DUF7344 domain-containing protein n=1 Tax=Haladaptatus halobius TaxID=2884875 RepID=UPI001D0AF107|nr:hypothetical protein [Haladaptatus halobius]
MSMPEISDDTPAEIFALVAQPRCRVILCYLLQQDRPLSLTELTRYITRQESDSSSQDFHSDKYDEVYESLTREHIPRLREAGLLTQKQTYEQTVITLTERVQYVKPALRPYERTPRKYHID